MFVRDYLMKIKELIALHVVPAKFLQAWALWQRGEIAKLGYGRPAYVLNGKMSGSFEIDENDLMLIDKAVTQLSQTSSREHWLIVYKYVHSFSTRYLKEKLGFDDNRYYRLLDNATTHFYQNLLKLVGEQQ